MFNLLEHTNPSKTAVIVIDVQNDFCHPEGYHGKKGAQLSAIEQMIPNLNALLNGARSAEVPVIFVVTHHSEWTNSPSWIVRRKTFEHSCYPGTWGADYYSTIMPNKGEATVIKHRYSAFVNTDLDLILRSRGIENLIVTGVNTNICVDSTARHGYMLDFFVIIAEDCCATTSPYEDHQAAIRLLKDRFAEIASSDQIMELWQTKGNSL